MQVTLLKEWQRVCLLCFMSLLALMSTTVAAEPLTVTLLDHQNRQVISNQQLVARQIMPDGSLKWRQKKTTDGTGNAIFDLDFSDGQQYLFETTVFNGFRSKLGPLSAPGAATLEAGQHLIVLSDGTSTDETPFASQKVSLRQVQPDGSSKHVASLTTDDTGSLKLDLQSGQYELKAKSLVSGRWNTIGPFSPQPSQQFAVGERPLSLTLTDAFTGRVVSGQEVTVWRITDEGRKWAGRKTTDTNGQILWELENLNGGQTFQVGTKYFGKFESRSAEISQSGPFNWQIGTVQVRLKDGSQDETPNLSNYAASLERDTGEGFKTLHNFTSDDSGWVVFDVPAFTSETAYRLRAKSAVDGKARYYHPLPAAGQSDFVVGQTPLTAILVDDKTGLAIPETQVTVRQLMADGSKKWIARKSTDAQGRAVFDLPELGVSQNVELSARVLNKQWSYSGAISSPGEFTFRIGTTRVALKNGNTENGVPLVSHSLEFWQERDGKMKRVQTVSSDAQGLVTVDLANLSKTTPYLLKARSAIDNKSVYEKQITTPGEHEFTVGSTPVSVAFTHAKTGQPLANQRVDLRKKSEDGKFRYFRHKNTDANGLAQFDTAEMGKGQEYQVMGKVFNNFAVYSEVFSVAGDYALAFGKLHVTVRDGSQASEPVLTDYSVGIRQVDTATGKSKWFSGAKTDSSGVIQIDLPSPPEGTEYQLSAKSLTDGKHKNSAAVPLEGDVTFVVGNQPLTVSVTDFATGASLSDLRVTAERMSGEGDWTWAASAKTNTMGQVVFDLDNINGGTSYRLKANKFRGTAYSQVIQQSGNLDFRLGQVPVLLSDRDSQTPLANVRLTAYRYLPDGSLKHEVSGNTDAQGQLTFDLRELGDTRYLVKAHKPFDGVRQIYSPVIMGPGQLNFAISADDNSDIDNQAPVVSIDAPVGDMVSPAGFVISGTAIDDNGLDRLELSVIDSFANSQTVQVTEFGADQWSVQIPADWLQVDGVISILATLYDRMGNQASAERLFSVIEDTTAPTLTVTSHAQQDNVNVSGFTVSGDVFDDLQVASLTATLQDSTLGEVFSSRELSIDPVSGQWAVYVGYGQVAQDSKLTLSLSASDASGNTTDETLQLNAVQINLATRHLLLRATFGLTPELEDQVTQMGANNWLEQQLTPTSIDDSELETLLSGLPVNDIDDLRHRELLYQIYSQRQLQQVMAWFWENHFSTNYRSHSQVAYEQRENDGFRTHALGNFRDLLEVSAKSPAMMIYLNNDESIKGNPNENYARELLELHTLGVDGGYTANDIAELARILTGWQVGDGGTFAFNAEDHDTDPKTFMGQAYLPDGVGEGEAVLDALSQHPSTASFICAKLVRFWVSDSAQPRLQQDCANAFLSSQGDVAATLRVVFNADEFNNGEYFAAKVKTPNELYISAMRSLNATPDIDQGVDIIDDMGMSLFSYPAPDGFADTGPDWINVNAMILRSRFAAQLAFESRGGDLDLVGLLTQRGIRTPDAIVGFLFELLLSSTTAENERVQALAILNEGTAFSLDSPEADIKLQRLIATLLSYPGFQYQ